DGEPVQANIGRFGPYIRYGNKFVSLRGDDDPYTITLERALELIEEKKQADANRIIKTFDGSELQVLNGRYGPDVTNGAKNAKIPKDREPSSLTLEECEALLAAAPERRARGKKASKKAAAAPSADGTAASSIEGADGAATPNRSAAKRKTAGKSPAKKKAKKTSSKTTSRRTSSAAAANDQHRSCKIACEPGGARRRARNVGRSSPAASFLVEAPRRAGRARDSRRRRRRVSDRGGIRPRLPPRRCVRRRASSRDQTPLLAQGAAARRRDARADRTLR